MKLGPTFAISVCLNLALAGVAFHLARKSATIAAPASPSASMIFQTSPVAGSEMSNSSGAVAYVTNRFDWRNVESEDWEQLVAGLRAIGCPEKTIRDILFARASRAFDKPDRPAGPALPFWTAGVKRQRAQREQSRLRDAEREKLRERLQRLIGFDADPREHEILGHLQDQALSRFFFGPMPEETFQRLVATVAHYDVLKDGVNSRAGGVLLAGDEDELKNLSTRLRQEMATLLTPTQAEEMNARCAIMQFGNKVEFEATDLTPADLRQVALAYAKVRDPLADMFELWHSPSDNEQELVHAAAREVLGATRYAQFERAADNDFRMLFNLGKELELPREAAVKVYDVRNLAQQELQRLRDDSSLSDAERNQRVEKMQTETQQAVLDALGAKACQDFLNRGGVWVTNLNKL